MATISATNWVPEEMDSAVIRKVLQESAIETHARRVPMATNVREVPRSAGTDVDVVAAGAAYNEAADTLDVVTLTARKFGKIFVITEEDLNDSLPSVLDTFKHDWAVAFARKFDNACLGVTVAGDGTDTSPFNSIYYEVNTAGNVTTVASGSSVSYDNLNTVLSSYEESDYFDQGEAIVIAHPKYRGYLRGIKDDNGQPVFVNGQMDNPDRLFGYQVHWSNGAATSATATHAPSGNPLLIVGNRQLLLNGVRSGPESMVSFDAAFESDEPKLKVRARRGFAVGRAAGFAVLEKALS